ncbi:MAG: ASKHA domain-containing protein [Candidatus Thorarchaeota archaeon]|nr:ASKHA domain-containing protein [Candidatus Thorarchaeota archaeon]
MSGYGVAIDIGTTSVSMSLFDISKKNAKIASLSFENPQIRFGEDVISRIRHQISDSSEKTNLTQLIREAISSNVLTLTSDNSLSPKEIHDVVIVGNTPMHHLFFDLPLNSLLVEPFTSKNIGVLNLDAVDVGLDLPNASCYSPPLIGSFVGSDALAVILGFGIATDIYPSLALDIGTNSEMIVQHNGKLLVASAASGPAFEGMSLACGMKASEGAIDKVHYDCGSQSLNVETIGNETPLGICGVGAVSALHALLQANLLNEEGSINRLSTSPHLFNRDSIYGIWLTRESANASPIYLNQMDIRMLQQSKAAIRTVTEILLLESNFTAAEIQNLYITGAFGNGLDLKAAEAIGMLPHVPNLKNIIQKWGGALLGAELLLLSQHDRLTVQEVAAATEYIDLMNHPQYTELHSRYSFFPR